MGWTGWIIPGVLLTVARIMSLAGLDRIASSLPLLISDNSRSRFLGRVIFGDLFVGVLVIIMIGLLIIGSVPDSSQQGLAMQDERDLESAGVYQSRGLYNESLPFYDKVIACNQSTSWPGMGKAMHFQDWADMMRCWSAMIEAWR